MSDGNSLNKNNLDNSNLNKMDGNKDTIIKIKSSDFQNKSFTKKLSKEVFILSREDYEFFMKFIYNDNNDHDSFNSKTQMGFNQQIKIISSIEEVENLIKNNIEFILLNKEYFKDINVIKGEGVIFFECINKKYLIFPKEKNKNNVLEISNGNINNLAHVHLLDINFTNKDNNSSNNINTDNQNKELETKEILKRLILLYAFEKHFIQLLNSPIKDEYDINEYYLINKSWINYYKTSTYQQKIVKILDEMKLEYSYKGFCINIDEILDIILNNNNKNNILSYLNNIESSHKNLMMNILSREEEFNPLINGNKIDFNETIQFPIEFILLPENLFDLFFEGITANKNSKENYKYNALIGDKATFIQSKQSNNIYYTYLLPEKNDCLVLSSIFRYLEKNIFYIEVKEYIKGKGWYNYFNQRKLINYPTSEFHEIKDGDKYIGEYKIYQPIDEKLRKEQKIQNLSNPLNKCKEIYKYYKKFISKLFKLKDNKNPIYNSIIDIDKFDYISTFIVSQKDFEKYEKKLLFKELEKLSEIKEKEKYNTYEKQLASNFNFKLVSDDVKNHFFIQDHIKCKFQLNLFCFVCKDLLLKINNDKDYSNWLEKQENFLFFVNNNEYFVYSPQNMKLYNVIFQDNNNIFFKLKKYEKQYEKKYEIKLKNNNNNKILEDIYQSEKQIEYYRNTSLSMKDSLKTYQLYLINREWMKNYKKINNYDEFVNNRKSKWNLQLSLFIRKDIPYNLEDAKNLIPKYDNSANCKIPLDFEIVEKDIFESIIKDINKKNIIIILKNNII